MVLMAGQKLRAKNRGKMSPRVHRDGGRIGTRTRTW
jgi:hypothetical protein